MDGLLEGHADEEVLRLQPKQRREQAVPAKAQVVSGPPFAVSTGRIVSGALEERHCLRLLTVVSRFCLSLFNVPVATSNVYVQGFHVERWTPYASRTGPEGVPDSVWAIERA